jgi:demethylmenaquinone methyltransferase/2-methoxy-6-polyprenyl-1,4-benzoquinol methylase
MTFASGTEKRKYVKTMFGRIAQRYDLMNRLMTLGQDVHWRRAMVQAAALPPGARFLDVATGTGDVAFAAAQREPRPELVVGTDFSLPMLQLAGARARSNHLPRNNQPGWSAGDTLCLPFPSNMFDAVASAFLMRNVTDVVAALREQLRVTRPGGQVLVLDVPRPGGAWLRRSLLRLYLHRCVPLLGGIITGQTDAYEYLPSSAEAFLTVDELASMMESIGLQQVGYRLFMMGAIALHVGRKPRR